MNASRKSLAFAWLGVFTIILPSSSGAQIVAPSQLTPQTLRPGFDERNSGRALPGGPSTDLPVESSELEVLVREVRVEGVFSELVRRTEEESRQLKGRRVTVGQIYRVAHSIEQAYAAAGYPLVRVVVPPQKLIDGGLLVLVVMDGFIESIDVTGVPERVRSIVANRAGVLVGRRHIKLNEIERAILIAGDVPGLKLRSTLTRGTHDGGTKLVLDGEHSLVTGSFGADNRLVQSLGTWELRGSVAVNGALGLGEQIYGTAGLGADLGVVAAGTSPLKVFGGGMVIPVGNDGLTLNPEYTWSTTRTAQSLGVPGSLGTFERYALRLRDPVIWTRNASLNVNVSLEYVKQWVDAPDFGVTLNADRYGVLRIGPDYAGTLPWGAFVQVGGLVSQGLGGRTAADAVASSIPLSRLGASSDFTKVNGYARVTQPLPADFLLSMTGYGQTTFGKPALRSEQFALDGIDAVSAFPAGAFSTDEGATLRGEISRSWVTRIATQNTTISPYGFGAVGRGLLVNATALERPLVDAAALGMGVRGRIERWSSLSTLICGLELARGFTDMPGVRRGWRGNVVASVVF